MRSAKIFLSIIVVIIISFFGSATFTSCVKETIHDTTFITVRDTLIIKDSLPGLTTGMVAWYNFNNGSLNDSSGHGNHIIFNNAVPAHDRFGKPNHAYLFDGKTNYMRIKNSKSLNPQNITIYAIVKVNGFYQGACHGNQIVSKGARYETNGFYTLGFQPYTNLAGTTCLPTVDYNKEVFVGIYGDNIPQGTASSALATSDNHTVYIQKNQWYSIAFTYDGSTARYYVNGALAAEVHNPGLVKFSPNGDDLYIGRSEDEQYPYFFNGVIDEIRIYNRAITPKEVGYLRTRGSNDTPPSTLPVQ